MLRKFSVLFAMIVFIFALFTSCATVPPPPQPQPEPPKPEPAPAAEEVVQPKAAARPLMLPVDPGDMTWHTPSSSTIAWDAPTLLADEEPIPPEDTVKYNIYIVAYADRATRDVSKVLGSELQEPTTALIGVPAGSELIVGVEAVHFTTIGNEEVEASRSIIVWSDDDDTERVPVPFGLANFSQVDAVFRLRIVDQQ